MKVDKDVSEELQSQQELKSPCEMDRAGKQHSPQNEGSWGQSGARVGRGHQEQHCGGMATENERNLEGIAHEDFGTSLGS